MIKIKDNGEPLVDIRKVYPYIHIDFASRAKKPANRALARETVVKMLGVAQGYLPKGYYFIIRDAWRSKAEQEKNIHIFFNHVGNKYPNWTKRKVEKYVFKFIAPSSGKFASGHMAGGALDLRIAKDGRYIPVNWWKLDYEENAKSNQPKLPNYLRKNREIMFSALKKAGFANCKDEYWHWSYGDIMWARENNKKIAIYGVVEKV